MPLKWFPVVRKTPFVSLDVPNKILPRFHNDRRNHDVIALKSVRLSFVAEKLLFSSLHVFFGGLGVKYKAKFGILSHPW